MRLSVCLSIATCLLLMRAGDQAQAAEIAAGKLGFGKSVQPFLRTHCIKCHGADEQEGDLTLHDISFDMSGEDSEKWLQVIRQLNDNLMPPEDEPQPGQALKRQVIGWVDSELARAGKGIDLAARLGEPSYGNRVDHDALFSGEHKGPAYSPSRLWRISPYISSARYQSGTYNRFRVTPSQPFSLADAEGLKDYSSMWRLDGPTLELLLINANEVVTRQIGPTPAEIEEMDREYLAKGGHPARKPSNRPMFSTVKEFRAMA